MAFHRRHSRTGVRSSEPSRSRRSASCFIRRGALSHTLSHPFSPTLSPGTYPSSLPPAPIVPPAREGHRRRFSDADKRRILEEAAQPDAGVAQIARRYGIARRVLCRWKQELAPPVFVAVQVTDADASPCATPITGEAVS